ncbi:MAG: GTPase Era [Mycoplasmataceae bacterium]|nr:GTPase Era [Mycoplasmataceae bacterium]
MKVCFIAIIGRPNVGKSSLMNAILDYDLSIISPKPQTTRDQILGIYNDGDYQFVFTDTPGIHKAESQFGEVLNDKSYKSFKEIDLVLFLQPADEEISVGDNFVIDKIVNQKNKLAVITKIDKISDPKIIEEKALFLKEKKFDAVLGTSISITQSVDSLINEIKKYSYESVPFYDLDDITDKSSSFIAKETIREAAINLLKEELPHAIVIEINEYKESEEEDEISATIYVQKDSQKGILIGAGGTMIKAIGTAARLNLSKKFDKNIKLWTKVKVQKNWTNDVKQIKKFGY